MLPATYTENQYTCNGTQTDFTYSWYIPDADSLRAVWQLGSDTPVVPIYITNYELSNIGVPGGGVLTFNANMQPPATAILTIYRDVPPEYNSDFSAPRAITGEALDYAFENLTLALQDLDTRYSGRAIKYSQTLLLPTDLDITIVPELFENQVWMGSPTGVIVAGTIPESPGDSLLRQQLASEVDGADGARLIGYRDEATGQGMTVHDALSLNTLISNNMTVKFPYIAVGSIYYDATDIACQNILVIESFPAGGVSNLLPPANIGYLVKDTTSSWSAGANGGSNIGAGGSSNDLIEIYIIHNTNDGTLTDIGTKLQTATFVSLPTYYVVGARIGYLKSGQISSQIDNCIEAPFFPFQQNNPSSLPTFSVSAVATNNAALLNSFAIGSSPVKLLTNIAASIEITGSLTVLTNTNAGVVGFDIFSFQASGLTARLSCVYQMFIPVIGSGDLPMVINFTRKINLSGIAGPTLYIYVSNISQSTCTMTGTISLGVNVVNLDKVFNGYLT